MVRNVIRGEPGLTWRGNPVDIGNPFPVWEPVAGPRGSKAKVLMVPITVHETSKNGKPVTHRRNVLASELERRK